MMKGYLAVIFASALIASGCTSTQYGYDDVYDHDYPVYASVQKDGPSDNRRYNGGYEPYEEEDYEYYGRNYGSSHYNGGTYSHRIRRFYGPSISFSYYSGFYGGYGGLGFSYHYNPWGYSYNPYSMWYYDPYGYHMYNYHHHHHSHWGHSWFHQPWYLYGFYPYSPSFCPPGYAYGSDHYYYRNNGYYAPRPNYGGYSYRNSAAPAYSSPGKPSQTGTRTYESGVKVRKVDKLLKDKDNYNPAEVNPRPKPKYDSQPRPKYNSPKRQTVPKRHNQPRQGIRRGDRPGNNNPGPKVSPSTRPRTFVAPQREGSSNRQSVGGNGVKVRTHSKE